MQLLYTMVNTFNIKLPSR